MATSRQARITRILDLSPTTRVLELAPVEALDFVGGQYLIVDTGLLVPDGRRVKRAYSIVSPDASQDHLLLAVRKLDGPGSRWMHARSAGDVLFFSGPWGRWLADDARPRRTLVLATDTGVTAALGLVRGRAFAPQRARAELVWLVEGGDYFLRDDFVAAALPAGVAYRRLPLPPVGHPERPAHAEWLAGTLRGFDSVFLAGDGAVLHRLRERCFGPEARIECFFNNPAKQST